MKWKIPAKTFLLGEYAAIYGAPALVLTTTPCFEIAISQESGLHGIHPESPAGKWWTAQGALERGLIWHDPYLGKGGMGASGAQFIGAYKACKLLQQKDSSEDTLLKAYFEYAWNGKGLRPSGYDVAAQCNAGCVYIHQSDNQIHTYEWPFNGLAFMLLHTGKKLATHEHLQTMALPNDIEKLACIVNLAKEAFEEVDNKKIIRAINAYHQQLLLMNLVAAHSIEYIELLKTIPGVQAIKGCGAMGADVLLLLVRVDELDVVKDYINNAKHKEWSILATNQAIYEGSTEHT